MMRLIWLFIAAIPDLLKLLDAIDQAQKQAALNRKVNDDLKVIHQAFKSKDASAITALFSSGGNAASP